MSEDPIKPNAQAEQAGASDESIQKVHSILLREKPEPKEGYTPMPLFILGFITVMIFVCTLYFVHYRGGFSPMVYDERYDPSTASASAQVTKVDPVAQGKRLFQTCAACHQATGMGVPGVYPALVGSPWVMESDKQVISILLHGLSGHMMVEDKPFNGNMPAFGPGGGYNWSDEKISYVLTYIRQEWGNKGAAITPEQVKAVRDEMAGHSKPWSAEELKGMK
ncbi:MAG TPA: cytochrome c [Rariglobus sp.]|jgi:mono/diheme cytochrome c family protein|nr:cytochrome c [Rariglobus sp.]